MQQSKWPFLAPVILGALILGCGGSGGVAPTPPTPEPPIITGNPANQTVFVGEPASFTVTATGPGLEYQWFLDGAAVAGATGSTYNIAAAAPSDAGEYVARVTNDDGTVNTAPATLTVRPNTGGAGVIVD